MTLMKRSQLTGCCREISRGWLLAAVACACIGSGISGCAADPIEEPEKHYWVEIDGITYQWPATASIAPVWVRVEDIAYQGDGDYRIEMGIWNRSQQTLILDEYSGNFYVQTEISGHWEELNAQLAGDTGDGGKIVLPARKAYRTVNFVNIPLDMPAIYKNNEGSICLKSKFQIELISAFQNDRLGHDSESLYWLIPETDTWILREGM